MTPALRLRILAGPPLVGVLWAASGCPPPTGRRLRRHRTTSRPGAHQRHRPPTPETPPTVFLDVRDLVGHPGETRDLHRSVAVEEVGDDPWGPAEDVLRGPIVLDLVLDAVVEGVWLHGTISWALELDCGRCLEQVRLERAVEVGELFDDPRRVDEGDEELEPGYVLVDEATRLDPERLLHDTIVLDLPTAVRCGRADCTPPVGDGVAVLDEDSAAATASDGPDPRWAALADIDLN